MVLSIRLAAKAGDRAELAIRNHASANLKMTQSPGCYNACDRIGFALRLESEFAEEISKESPLVRSAGLERLPFANERVSAPAGGGPAALPFHQAHASVACQESREFLNYQRIGGGNGDVLSPLNERKFFGQGNKVAFSCETA